MSLRLQRRVAAEILKVGKDRVWIDPKKIGEVEDAITRDDKRTLIKQGIINAKQAKGTSRVRARKRHLQRKKGRRRGHGKRKGRKYSRITRKERWMMTIRAIRKKLKELRDKEAIDRKTYRKLYIMARSGRIKSKCHLMQIIKEMRA